MTFSRLAKLLAIGLVAFALWRARPPAEPPRVVVLALPAAAADFLSVGNSEDWGGMIDVSVPTPGAAFWRELLAIDEDAGHDLDALWSGQNAAARGLAVPSRLFAAPEQAAVTGSAFLGSSAGVVVEAADITAGRLPPPYDRAVDAISAAAANLRREEWSDWITVDSGPPASPAAPPGPQAQFQLARFSDTSYFFSPAYVLGTTVVASTPFLRGLDRELRPLVASHAIALAQRRMEASADLFREGGDERPVVVFDTVAEDAATVFSPDTTPSAVVEAVRDAIASDVVALRGAVGPQGVLMIVGGPPTTRQSGVPAWYRIVAGGSDVRAGGSLSGPGLSLAAARAVVRHLVGVALDAEQKTLIPAAIANRFPIRPTTIASTAPARSRPPDQDWTAATLESVPGALGSGR